MPVMKSIEADCVPTEQIVALKEFASNLDESDLRDLLLGLSRGVESGLDLSLIEESAEFTPAQAAERLGMSRTHLYKLLESGEILSHRVGSHHKIRAGDLIRFEAARQRDRRELAERYARREQTRKSVISSLAEDL